jgi:hypothetical protein
VIPSADSGPRADRKTEERIVAGRVATMGSASILRPRVNRGAPRALLETVDMAIYMMARAAEFAAPNAGAA